MILEEALEMPAPQYEFWKAYQQRYGFPVDRVVWAIAKAGSAICRACGGKAKPQDLIPVFVVQRGMSVEALSAELAALPGAKVERVSAEEMKRRQAASRTI